MKKKVLLNIISKQYINKDVDEIRVETYGDFYKSKNNFYISYIDSLATGFENHKTLLKIEEKRVIIKRIGKYESVLIIDTNIKTISKYPTEFGNMFLEISEVEIKNNLKTDGGLLNIAYNIEIENKHICRTNLNIDVRVL